MGSATSKGAKSATSKISSAATSSAARKYPTRSTGAPTSSTSSTLQSANAASIPPREEGVGPVVHSEVSARPGKDAAIQRDALDPDMNHGLNERMRQLGPVTPNPTQSNSSTFNQQFQSASDPSLSSSFQPSASTPSQSIFPTRQNPAISLLTARYRLAEEAEKEFAGLGRKGALGRSFLDVVTLRQVLVLREQGVQDAEIERRMELKKGVVGRLGREGLVGVAG